MRLQFWLFFPFLTLLYYLFLFLFLFNIFIFFIFLIYFWIIFIFLITGIVIWVRLWRISINWVINHIILFIITSHFIFLYFIYKYVYSKSQYSWLYFPIIKSLRNELLPFIFFSSKYEYPLSATLVLHKY